MHNQTVISGNITGNMKINRMPKTRNTPLANHRDRMRRAGMVRLELRVHEEDAALLRGLARSLSDPQRQSKFRALLRSLQGPVSRPLKALLAGAPLEDIDLDRSREFGRAVDL